MLVFTQFNICQIVIHPGTVNAALSWELRGGKRMYGKETAPLQPNDLVLDYFANFCNRKIPTNPLLHVVLGAGYPAHFSLIQVVEMAKVDVGLCRIARARKKRWHGLSCATSRRHHSNSRHGQVEQTAWPRDD